MSIELNYNNKQPIPFSYAYYDFIGNGVLDTLRLWAVDVFNQLLPNGVSHNRYFNNLSNLSRVPEEVFLIKTGIEKLIDRPFIHDPFFGDFLSFNLQNAAIHKHKDDNCEGKTHTRFNLLLSVPEAGGNPIYNGSEFEVKEGMLWRCEAGRYEHSSTAVIGKKPRINLSFGFQIQNA